MNTPDYRWFMEPESVEQIDGIDVTKDIVYSKTDQGDLTLDVHRPSGCNGKPLPTVLFLYGGAFEMGNKHQLSLYKAHTLPLDGFAVVSINYRLSDQAVFPAQLRDTANALLWIGEHGHQYNLDARRIGVWGTSAGGMLAALIGVGAADQIFGSDPSDSTYKVKAVVDFFGPTDFLQGDEHAAEGHALNWNSDSSWPSRFLGGALPDIPDQVATANPANYVTPENPPFLIVHGERDSVVPLHQSQILNRAQLNAGAESELYVVKDGGHAYGGEFGTDALHKKVVTFFNKHLGD